MGVDILVIKRKGSPAKSFQRKAHKGEPKVSITITTFKMLDSSTGILYLGFKAIADSAEIIADFNKYLFRKEKKETAYFKKLVIQ